MLAVMPQRWQGPSERQFLCRPRTLDLTEIPQKRLNGLP